MRRSSPAAERNKQPIAQVLDEILPNAARVLEIASGSGEHAIHFGRTMPSRTFLPSDASNEARASIADYVAAEGLPNVEPPRAIDVLASGWHIAVDAVLCINMIHIAPWEATRALYQGAAKCLEPGGLVVLYGPYRFDGEFLAPSNRAFDDDLRARNPAWGVRDLAEVDAVAASEGFVRERLIALPANNHVVVHRFGGSAQTMR